MKNNYTTTKFYKLKENVEEYDKIRFKSTGGKVIDLIEKENFNSLIDKRDKTQTVLDAGAGTGRMSVFLANKGFKVFALDNSDNMLNKLSKLKNKNIRVIRGSIKEIPFEDNTFDMVISSRVLFHFNEEETFAIVNELYRVTKNGGKVIFDTFNVYSIEHMFKYKYRYLNFFMNTGKMYRFLQDKSKNIKCINGFFIPHFIFLYAPRPFPKILRFLDEKLFCKIFGFFASRKYWLIKK